MWQPHLRALCVIILKRHELFGVERYPFIIYYVLIIDSSATLSSCSKGEFVDAMVEHQLLTIALPPLRLGSSEYLYPEEVGSFAPVQLFGQRITILSCRLGQLANELREQARQEQVVHGRGWVPSPVEFLRREARVAEIRNALTSVWRDEMPMMVQGRGLTRGSNLPTRMGNCFQYVRESHTS